MAGFGDVASFLGAGLLSGVGQGLVEDGKTKREAALKELEGQNQRAHDERLTTRAETAQTGLLARQTAENDARDKRQAAADAEKERRQQNDLNARDGRLQADADARAARADQAAADRLARENDQVTGNYQDPEGNVIAILKGGGTKNLGKGAVKAEKPATNPAQDAANQRIDAAREQVKTLVTGKIQVGQAPEDYITSATQRTVPDALGGNKPNPNYNPRLASLVRDATRAKVGGDDNLDTFNDFLATPREATQAEAASKAETDATAQATQEAKKFGMLTRPPGGLTVPQWTEQRKAELLGKDPPKFAPPPAPMTPPASPENMVAPTGAAPVSTPPSTQGPEAIISAARDAIKKGADRAKVIERLTARGITPPSDL